MGFYREDLIFVSEGTCGIKMLNKNTLGVKKVRGQSEASHNGYISDQKL